MFCIGCGQKLHEGAAFCAGCGAKSVGNASAQQTKAPVTAQAPASTVRAVNFKCSVCSAPLKIPSNARGQVTCPYCKADCLIQGLINNAEMAAKENINSGYPLLASPSTLHSKLISVLAGSPNMPLDVFEQAEVIREEHHCVPAYCFSCGAKAEYSYEKGVDRIEIVVDNSGRWSLTGTREIVVTDWHHDTGSISGNYVVFTPGNKELAKQVSVLYGDLSSSKLIDFDDLIFTSDVQMRSFNLPQISAYNDYAITLIANALEKDATDSFFPQAYRNFSLNSAPVIQKEMTRVILGMYNIVFKYRDEEFSVWMSGDGERAYYESLPVDMQRTKTLESKKQSMERAVESIPAPRMGALRAGMALSVIVPIVLMFIRMPSWYQWWYGLCLGIWALLIFSQLKKKKPEKYDKKCEEVRANHQRDIDNYLAQPSKIVNTFIEKKRGLRGIYANAAIGQIDVAPVQPVRNEKPDPNNIWGT